VEEKTPFSIQIHQEMFVREEHGSLMYNATGTDTAVIRRTVIKNSNQQMP
jgi:hypothetical protein